jgi:hypothetical protein
MFLGETPLLTQETYPFFCFLSPSANRIINTGYLKNYMEFNKLEENQKGMMPFDFLLVLHYKILENTTLK